MAAAALMGGGTVLWVRATVVWLSLSALLGAELQHEHCDVSFGDLESIPEGWAKDAAVARASGKLCSVKSPPSGGASVVRAGAPTGASGARLSYGHAPSSMALTWEMPNTTMASYVPVVELTAKGGSPTIVTGITAAPNFCGTMGPMQCHVNLTGLQANTRYSYRYGVKGGALSAEMSFVTAPAPGSNDTFKLAIYGDMGVDWSGPTIQVLEKMAKAGDIDFVVHNGDISYADNRYNLRNHTVYQDWMGSFYEEVSVIATVVPYMLGVGNHEYPCNYSEFVQRAAMVPHAESGSPSPFYYSRRHGYMYLIHISIFLNSKGSAEWQWLEQELRTAQALKKAGEVSWIFTFTHYMHQPTGYCTYSWGVCCNGTIQGDGKPCSYGVSEFFKEAEDLFVKSEVDIHFTAHQHSYERTVPMYRYAAEPKYAGPVVHPQALFNDPIYPMYVVCGSPGNVETFPATWMSQPSWSVPSMTQSFGFVHMTANRTSLTVDYRTSAEDLPGLPGSFSSDHFVVTRSAAGQTLKRTAIADALGRSAAESLVV